MDGNIKKAKTKMLAERDLLFIIILRGRRRENRKPRVCNRSITTKIFQGYFYLWFTDGFLSNRGILLLYYFQIFSKIGTFDIYQQYYLGHTGLILFSSNYMNVLWNSELNYMVTYFYHLPRNSLVLCNPCHTQ